MWGGGGAGGFLVLTEGQRITLGFNWSSLRGSVITDPAQTPVGFNFNRSAFCLLPVKRSRRSVRIRRGGDLGTG